MIRIKYYLVLESNFIDKFLYLESLSKSLKDVLRITLLIYKFVNLMGFMGGENYT